MNLFEKEIPPDTLVQIRIEAEGNLVTYGHGTIAQVLECDWPEMEFDCDDHTLKRATLEIHQLSNGSSDMGAENECLGTMEVGLFDEDEPDPPLKIDSLTGFVEMLWGSWSYQVPSIQCIALNDVRLKKQGLHIGHLYVPFKEFESGEQESSNNFKWYIGGELVSSDASLFAEPLWTDLANDLHYILDHSRKDTPKTFDYLAGSGMDIGIVILDLILEMPLEKRRYILCDQTALQGTIRRYRKDGAIGLR